MRPQTSENRDVIDLLGVVIRHGLLLLLISLRWGRINQSFHVTPPQKERNSLIVIWKWPINRTEWRHVVGNFSQSHFWWQDFATLWRISYVLRRNVWWCLLFCKLIVIGYPTSDARLLFVFRFGTDTGLSPLVSCVRDVGYIPLALEGTWEEKRARGIVGNAPVYISRLSILQYRSPANHCLWYNWRTRAVSTVK